MIFDQINISHSRPWRPGMIKIYLLLQILCLSSSGFGVTLSGKVISKESFIPIFKAEIHVLGNDMVTTSSVTGNFILNLNDDLLGKTITLLFYRYRYESRLLKIDIGRKNIRTATIKLQQYQREPDFLNLPNLMVTGRVLDRNGNALSKVEIFAANTTGLTFSDRAGNFHIYVDQIRPINNLTLWFHKPGHRSTVIPINNPIAKNYHINLNQPVQLKRLELPYYSLTEQFYVPKKYPGDSVKKSENVIVQQSPPKLIVVVKNSSGEAIPGARVTFDRRTVSTNKLGEATILSQLPWGMVSINAENFISRAFDIMKRSTEERIDVVMARVLPSRRSVTSIVDPSKQKRPDDTGLNLSSEDSSPPRSDDNPGSNNPFSHEQKTPEKEYRTRDHAEGNVEEAMHPSYHHSTPQPNDVDHLNPEIEVKKGIRYLYGNGLSRDSSKAAHHFRLGADAGDIRAMTSLGRMYLKGWESTQNDKIAFDWFIKAAKAGHPKAMNNLSWMYLKGKGTKRNNAEALRWFLKSAQKRNTVAMLSLGYMYENGKGVKKNDDIAVSWYRKAASYGNVKAKKYLSQLFKTQ